MTTPPGPHSERIQVWVDPEIAPLVPTFLENRRQDIVTIGEAVKTGDFETARRLGHSMRGSGGGYGFHAITELGEGIERAAVRADAVEIRGHLEALRRYLERVDVATDEPSLPA